MSAIVCIMPNITIRMDDDTYETLKAAAEEEGRSMSNYLSQLVRATCQPGHKEPAKVPGKRVAPPPGRPSPGKAPVKAPSKKVPAKVGGGGSGSVDRDHQAGTRIIDRVVSKRQHLIR